MTQTTTLMQDVLETIRVTCGEMGIGTEQITAAGLRESVRQMSVPAADGRVVGDEALWARLRDSADEMDQPVSISDIAASLRQWGVR